MSWRGHISWWLFDMMPPKVLIYIAYMVFAYTQGNAVEVIAVNSAFKKNSDTTIGNYSRRQILIQCPYKVRTLWIYFHSLILANDFRYIIDDVYDDVCSRHIRHEKVITWYNLFGK